MINKIIAVVTALIIALSACCVRVDAFEFDGSDRTKQEALSDWFEALQEFANDPVNKADDMVKANHRLNVDMVALGYEDYYDYLQGFTGGLLNDGGMIEKINDANVNKLTDILNNYGINTPKQQFEDWYQNKYGKDYYKHNLTPYPTSSQYYLFFERYEGEEKLRVFIESYDGTPLTVKEDENGKYFEGKELGKVVYKMYKKSIKNKETGEWSEWFAINDDWSTGYVSQSKCYLDEIFVRNGCPMNIRTNLPLNYWGDIIGGDPVTDWSELGDDFVSEDIPEGLTPDEFNDFLSDLLNDLKDSMPDLTTVEGILQAIYRKCCSIDGKMGKQDKSNVSSAINQAVLALVASNNENANKIIAALGDLKGDLNADTDEIAGKLDKIHATLIAWGIADTVTDLVDLDSLTDGELSKINALADIAIMLSNLLPIAVVNTQITTLQAIVFQQAPPTDLTFTVLNSKCVMLSSDFFQQSDVIHAVSIARTLVSIILMMMWLLGMRRKLSSVG